MSDDLPRHFTHEPVSARPDTLVYRTAKFVLRHRAAVALAALAFVAAIAGLVGTAIQARTANRERAIAQRRFSEVRQLASKLFDIDEQASQLPGSTRTRQLIVDTSLEYLRRLSTDVSGDPGLALELGHAYLQVARVQGVSTGRNLGQMNEAEQNLRTAEGLIGPVLAVQPANRTALLRAAQAAHDRMILAGLRAVRRDRAGRAEALALARKAAEWLDRFNAAASDKPEEIEEVLSLYMNVADQYMLGKQFDDALRVCGRAGDLARSLGRHSALGMFQWVSAEVLQQRGDLDQALKAIRASVTLLDTGEGNMDVRKTMSLAHVLIWEGRILGQDNGISLGRWEDAAVSLDRAFRITDAVVHQDPSDQSSRGRLAMAGAGLAGALRRSDARRALAVYDHTLRHLAEIRGNAVIDRMEVEALSGSTYPLRRLGRAPEARKRLDGAFERLSRLKLYPAEKITPGSVTDKTLRALPTTKPTMATSRALSTSTRSYSTRCVQLSSSRRQVWKMPWICLISTRLSATSIATTARPRPGEGSVHVPVRLVAPVGTQAAEQPVCPSTNCCGVDPVGPVARDDYACRLLHPVFDYLIGSGAFRIAAREKRQEAFARFHRHQGGRIWNVWNVKPVLGDIASRPIQSAWLFLSAALREGCRRRHSSVY